VKSLIKALCLGGLILILSVSTFAAAYYVDDNDPNDPGPYDPNVSNPLEDGSLNHPFDRVQEAIEAAAHGDTVIVHPGQYQYAGNVAFNGKNIALTSTNPEDPDVVAATILDGGGNRSVVTFSGSETSDCILRGFTITNGSSANGGGIIGNRTHAAIENCVITGNTAYYEGGGLYRCDGPIERCTVINNMVTLYNGGGLYECHGSITNCTINSNSANSDGGGLARCNGSIVNCKISDNTAVYNGGGLVTCVGNIQNCIIIGNAARGGGGLEDCDGTITNCTIVGNTAGNFF